MDNPKPDSLPEYPRPVTFSAYTERADQQLDRKAMIAFVIYLVVGSIVLNLLIRLLGG